MSKKMINFVKEFTDMPAGRYREDGRFSGQVFREDLLIPALTGNDRVMLDLSDAYGFGSSFLEEAFGGVVRNKSFTLEELKKKLEIVCNDDPMTVEQIWLYIEEANDRL